MNESNCICKNCGISFHVRPARIKKGGGKFCSLKCKGIFSRNPIKICEYCGKEFWKPNNKNRKYCSRQCTGKARKSGEIIKCECCGKKVYKYEVHLKKHKHHFCSLKCANVFQRKNKIEFTCKICGKEFVQSKSRRRYNFSYCSLECRNRDPDFKKRLIEMNIMQQSLKPNKLELKGREILENIGLKRNEDFYEQKFLFNKFLVDVYLPEFNLIIQWDGIYWHIKPKRKHLDKSQDAYMKKCGLNVLRFTDKEIKDNEEKIRQAIKQKIYWHR